jgi:16S rRNA (guanine527-N7)-methyltransferase
VQVEHALGFMAAREIAGQPAPPSAAVDLGSGGGIPGLVLAALWPQTQIVLLDANRRRCAALRRAVQANAWEGRVKVAEVRAEVAGHDPTLRASADLVVARSFGPPPVVAECAAPLLKEGGLLVVSEPPLSGDSVGDDRPEAVVGHADRWPHGPLGQLGLEPDAFYVDRSGYQVLRQVSLCPARFPRRVGVPAKRPLY